MYRIQKATESLKSFRPAAQASFEDYIIDITTQQEALGDLSFQSSGKFKRKRACDLHSVALTSVFIVFRSW